MRLLPVKRLVLALALLLATARQASCQTSCQRQLSPCSCETTDGSLVDLAPLSSPAGFPFSDSVSGGADTFQWSPCLGQLCGVYLDTAVCETYGNNKLPIGVSESAKFVTHPSRGLQLVYTDSRAGVQYTSYVVLVCDQAAEQPTFSAEGGVYEIFMHLRSKHACPVGSGGGGGGASSVSTGDVLCIILILCIVLYLAGGLLLNRFLLGKEGAELVPNKDFWVAMPGYIKDGCLFTVQKLGCRIGGGGGGGSGVGGTRAYEAI